jgi:FixJ family two-component response regulator
MARRPKSVQRMAQRAQIVLACAAGRTNQEVAADLRVHYVTVGK